VNTEPNTPALKYTSVNKAGAAIQLESVSAL